MAWTESRIFTGFISDDLSNTTNFDLSGTGVNDFKVALYNNNITPDNKVASSATRFSIGQWATTNEVISTGAYWPTGGVLMTNPAISQLTAPNDNIIKWSASNLTTGGTVTLNNFAGCLIYDDTITTPNADQGICYNWFGGVNTVVAGTFTIVWSNTGIMSFTT